MSTLKTRIIVVVIAFIFILFFSNDFGLIDIKKTAIITAVAIDKDQNGYEVTAQIAVPEATDANTENQKAEVSGKGTTIGAAIKDIGDVSGWYPRLDFCNLIIIGNDIAKENTIKVLDYFAKTLRIQDSAVVVVAEKKANDILKISTPLDNISSFALQKVLLKASGFDRDVVDSNVKTFATAYYSKCRSAVMPLVKIEKQEDSESSSGGSTGSGGNAGGSQQSSGQQKDNNKGNSLFNVRTTALFYQGVLVGELNENETLAYNMLFDDFENTTIELNDVMSVNEEPHNYLLTVKKCKPNIRVNADKNGLSVDITVDLYCKISDQNAEGSDSTLSKNNALPDGVIKKAEETIYSWLDNLVKKEIESSCDFLKIKQKIYRHHHKFFDKYKDTFLAEMKPVITVKVSGQK